jgi:small subunit ribosomal protein S5
LRTLRGTVVWSFEMDRKARRFPNRGGSRGGGRDRDGGNASGLEEKVIHVGRCSKVVQGGRRFSFSALVVVGDRAGRVGVGYGRGREVPEAVRKANEKAKNAMRAYSLRGTTIPHEVIGEADGGKVFLRPASEGTGLVAGGGVRAVLELVGAKNILSKSMRSSNSLSTVRATLDALKKLRSHERVMQLRGRCAVPQEA